MVALVTQSETDRGSSTVLHFAQTAIALVAAGASILIVGGLVRETVRKGGEHFHLFPDAHERTELPAENPVEAATTKAAIPFPRAQDKNARLKNNARSRSDKDRALRRKRPRKERRQTRRRERSKEKANKGGSTATADGDDA